MNQTYQIVLVLKGIVQCSNPLAISIHQDISLFSEASCLKGERGKSHCQHQQVVFTGWIYMDVLWDYLKLLNRGLYSLEFSLHKWQARESLQACSQAFSHSNPDCNLKNEKTKKQPRKKKQPQNQKTQNQQPKHTPQNTKKNHKPIRVNCEALFHNVFLKARKMITCHCNL